MGIVSRKLTRESLRIVSVLLLAAFFLVSCQSAHAISITTTTLPVGQLLSTNQYSATIQSTGGGSPYTWSIISGSLPPGLTLNNSGQASTTITGIPTAVGTYNFTVKVKGGSGFSNTKALSIIVDNMDVSVSGNEILINGTQGALNGVVFVGIDNTTACVANYPYYSTPWNDWQNGAAAELQAAKSMGANTVRFQVALDELYESTQSNPNFDQSIITGYITTVDNAVAQARSLGMAVIVSMQWEKGTSGAAICDGNGNPGSVLTGNPSSDPASNAWSALLSSSGWTFNNDPGVLLEIYNEPVIDTSGVLAGTSNFWSDWNNALQPLVNAIRSDGSNNALIVPGLNGEKFLDATSIVSSNGNGNVGCAIYNASPDSPCASSYMLTDNTEPSPQLIYAVHPYPHDSSAPGVTTVLGYFSAQDWNTYFGNVAQTMPAPVMITEWFSGGKDGSNCWDTVTPKQPSPTPTGYTSPTNFSSPTVASDLFSWLQTAAPTGSTPNAAPMSIVATGFDVEYFYLKNLPTASPWTPPSTYYPTNFTDYSPFQCGTVTGPSLYLGPGEDLQTYFQNY